MLEHLETVNGNLTTYKKHFPRSDYMRCVKNQTSMHLVAKLARYFSHRTRVMQVQV